MELEPVERQRPVLDGGDRAGRGRGQRDEVGAGVEDLVAVAHPDDRLVRDVVEERLVRGRGRGTRPDRTRARRGLRPVPPSASTAKLHAVADSQDRDAQLEEAPGRTGAHRARKRCSGPPERIRASGFSSRTRSGVMSWRTIRANACRSRTRRAMNWTYWAPKSRTRTGRAAGSMGSMCVVRSSEGNRIVVLNGQQASRDSLAGRTANGEKSRNQPAPGDQLDCRRRVKSWL